MRKGQSGSWEGLFRFPIKALTNSETTIEIPENVFERSALYLSVKTFLGVFVAAFLVYYLTVIWTYKVYKKVWPKKKRRDPPKESFTMLTTLLASDQNAEFTTDIVVIRQPRTEFTANIQGQCINRYISSTEVQEIPEQGVEVTLTFMDQDGITLHTLFDQTDVTGGFAFFVQWTDDNPRNFDGSVSTAVEDLSIPEGEDGLYVQIQFAAPFNDPALPEDSLDIDGGDDALFDSADFALKSWINPNYLPDAVIETTL